MTSKTMYSLVVALVALLIISSAAAAYYYYEFGQEAQSNSRYLSGLTTATSQYDQLASSYDSALSLYNRTLSLLVRTIAVVNTSQPVYQQATVELSQLWSSYLKLEPASSSSYSTSVLLDFGNGTRRWYNNTAVQPGWNLYTTTVLLTKGNLQATYYPTFGEHLVTGIDGVSDSKNMSWFTWTFDSANRSSPWQAPQVGADQLPVYNGSVFAWTYCAQTSSYEPTCKP